MPTISAVEASPGGRRLRLSDRVHVRRRFLRSVNLERDFYAPDALDGYVMTPASLSTLERLSQGITQPGARAWSLTGAYGTGKSAFALMAPPVLGVALFRP